MRKLVVSSVMNQAEQDLLVLAAQRGNQQAFGLLFKLLHKPLISFAIKLSEDKELACDAVQDSWIKASRNIRRLKDPRAFKSWIYRLVRWRTLDLLRVKTRDSARLEPIDENTISARRSDRSENRSEIGSLISKLPATEKEIIHLFYLNEMTIAEISVVLEIPAGTVKSRLNRARNLLRKKYQGQET